MGYRGGPGKSAAKMASNRFSSRVRGWPPATGEVLSSLD